MIMTICHKVLGVKIRGRFTVYRHKRTRLYLQDNGSVFLGEKWGVIAA